MKQPSERRRHAIGAIPIFIMLALAPPGVALGQARVPDTLASEYDALITSGQTFDNLGVSIDIINDLDGDGIDDIIAGDPLSSLGGASHGRVVALSARTGAVIYTIFGPQTLAWFGNEIANIGDTNGDGMDDILVSAEHWDLPGAPNGNQDDTGRAFIYSGADGSLLQTFTGVGSGRRFGFTLDALGDIDGDGMGDVVVGDAITAFVFSGATGAPLAVHNLGAFVVTAAVGDVNGDGVPDYAAGICRSDAVGPNLGEVDVFSGADHSLIWQLADVETRRLANWLAGADVNGDGFNDIIAGNSNFSGPNGPRSGRVVVFDGATGNILYRLDGDQSVAQGGDACPGDHFGSVLKNVGDLDGDQCDDFLVFAGGNDAGGINNGRTYLYSGKLGTRVRTWTGTIFPDGISAGMIVSEVSDVDGDGSLDFIAKIGTLNTQTFSSLAHIAYFLGNPLPPCDADINNDDVVNGVDLAIVLSGWGPDGGFGADINSDGVVNGADLAQLLVRWGSCFLFDITLP